MQDVFNTMSNIVSGLVNWVEYHLFGVEGHLIWRSQEDRKPLYNDWCKEIEDNLVNSALDFKWFYYNSMEPEAKFSTGVIEGLDEEGAKKAAKRINEIIGKDLFDFVVPKSEDYAIACCLDVYEKDFLAEVLKKNNGALDEVRDFLAKCEQVGKQGQPENQNVLDMMG